MSHDIAPPDPPPPSACGSPASPTSRALACDRHLTTLWTRMEEIYPHRWSATLGAPGSSAFRTWRRALADLSVAQLARGVAACICRSDPWPPSLPEFRTLCLGDAPSLGLPDEEGPHLELTTGSGRPTAAQRAWLDALTREGYRAALCRGWQDAAAVIVLYLRARVPSAERPRAYLPSAEGVFFVCCFFVC